MVKWKNGTNLSMDVSAVIHYTKKTHRLRDAAVEADCLKSRATVPLFLKFDVTDSRR